MINDLFNLDNYVSVITGAAQGLGMHMAKALAQAGSNIVIADLNIEKAHHAAKEIEKAGVKTLALKMDVTNIGDIQNMISIVIKGSF